MQVVSLQFITSGERVVAIAAVGRRNVHGHSPSAWSCRRSTDRESHIWTVTKTEEKKLWKNFIFIQLNLMWIKNKNLKIFFWSKNILFCMPTDPLASCSGCRCLSRVCAIHSRVDLPWYPWLTLIMMQQSTEQPAQTRSTSAIVSTWDQTVRTLGQQEASLKFLTNRFACDGLSEPSPKNDWKTIPHKCTLFICNQINIRLNNSKWTKFPCTSDANWPDSNKFLLNAHHDKVCWSLEHASAQISRSAPVETELHWMLPNKTLQHHVKTVHSTGLCASHHANRCHFKLSSIFGQWEWMLLTRPFVWSYIHGHCQPLWNSMHWHIHTIQGKQCPQWHVWAWVGQMTQVKTSREHCFLVFFFHSD